MKNLILVQLPLSMDADFANHVVDNMYFMEGLKYLTLKIGRI